MDETRQNLFSRTNVAKSFVLKGQIRGILQETIRGRVCFAADLQHGFGYVHTYSVDMIFRWKAQLISCTAGKQKTYLKMEEWNQIFYNAQGENCFTCGSKIFLETLTELSENNKDDFFSTG